jgi:Zn-dependent protease with chaperone function
MTEWLFTFFIHSTLCCGLAWLWMRLRPKTHAHLREALWYTALAASFVTPTIQTFITPETAFWRLPLPSVVRVEKSHLEPEREHEDGGRVASVDLVDREERHDDQATSSSWIGFAGTAWIAIAGGLVLGYFIRLGRFRQRLQHRDAVEDPSASRALVGLSRRAALSLPPRLTESDNLGSPVALGVGGRREICVPVRALHELDEGELSALLGHEIAHHLRHDTVRLAVLNIVQAVFFFQPFFRLAIREVHFAAEEQCDDWAASQLEDRYAMASCLTEVAGWVVRQDRYIPVPCIGRRLSQLELRVRRLLDDQRAKQAPPRAWRTLSLVGLLAVTPWFAPSLSPAVAAPHEDRLVIEHEQARTHEHNEHDWRNHRRREHHSGSEHDTPREHQ